MAKAARFNVYVTPAGFYDAVVAAPNQKAALQAWGSHADLFAEKLAQVETDMAWRERALAAPGEVLKKPRGDVAELMTQPRPSARRKPKSPASSRPHAKPEPPPRPPPDRTKLNAAEAALARAQAETERVRADFSRRREALELAERSAKEHAQAEVTKAEVDRDREANAFSLASR